jgi:hypothetical protein
MNSHSLRTLEERAALAVHLDLSVCWDFRMRQAVKAEGQARRSLVDLRAQSVIRRQGRWAREASAATARMKFLTKTTRAAGAVEATMAAAGAVAGRLPISHT